MTYLINYESGAIKKINKLPDFLATVKTLIILTFLKAKIDKVWENHTYKIVCNFRQSLKLLPNQDILT